MRGFGTFEFWSLELVSDFEIRASNLAPRGGRRRANVQNEPNLAPPEGADGGNCAKQSQTWGDWGVWAKAFILWGLARPGSETCETNPISRRAGPGRDPKGVGRGAHCAKQSQFGGLVQFWPHHGNTSANDLMVRRRRSPCRRRPAFGSRARCPRHVLPDSEPGQFGVETKDANARPGGDL
jgi:hypothetical protein